MSFALLLMFLFMIYTNPAYLAPAANVDHAIPLVGIAAMLILMVHKMASKEKLQFQWPESYLMLGLIGAAGLSCFTALSHNAAVAVTGDLAKIAVIYFLIINVADTELKVRIATLAMIAGGLVPAIAILNGIRAGSAGTFEGPKDLAYGLVVLVPLTIQLARQVRPLFQPFLAGISVLYAMAVFAGGSEACIFGLAAALLVMGLRQSGRSFRPLTAALLIGIVVFLSNYWATETQASNLNLRLVKGQTGVPQQPLDAVRIVASIVNSHPILGVGLGCSRVGWRNAGTDTGCSSPGAHNTVAQAVREIGVLGLIPFALLIVTAFIHSDRIFRARNYDQSATSMALGLEGALTGFLVYAMFGNYLVSWSPYIVLGLVSALSLVLEKQSAANEIVPSPALASSTCSPAVLEAAA